MTEVITILLPWPAPALWQNRRVHWRVRHAFTKAARHEAHIVALKEGIRELDTDSPFLRFAFHPPDARRRDLQNMPATQKAAIDGIADAMGCDDRGFRCVWPVEWGEKVEGGCVVVEVSEQ